MDFQETLILVIETIYVGIGLIGANIAFLVGYLAYILPETENCIKERRTQLDSKLDTKIDEKVLGKSLGELLVDFLGEFSYQRVESRQIEKWSKVFSQIKNYIIFSIVLSLIAIVLQFVLYYNDLMKNYYFPEVFILASTIYFGSFIFIALNHRTELHRWKISKKRI